MHKICQVKKVETLSYKTHMIVHQFFTFTYLIFVHSLRNFVILT